MANLYKHFLFTAVLMTLIFSKADAQPADPVLRLETGMHNARANSISTDVHGRYLLSCSNDKVARFWEASTGKLLNTLRIPIGDNDEGQLYACALHPESKTAAVGGSTGGWEKHQCIYILNPFTGEMVNKLCDLPDVVNRLEFSKDGQWLAAGLGSHGVMVYNTRTWRATELNNEDTNMVYGLSFDQHNNLVTAGFDHFIRLYSSPNFVLTAQTSELSGKEPYSVAFNASGAFIAVGYNKCPAVDVLYTKGLHLAYKPDVRGIPADQDLSAVSFSSDGNTLFAGGAFAKENSLGERKYIVRTWADAGKGVYEDLRTLDNAVLEIKPLPNGKMVLAGAFPDIAVLEAAGNTKWCNTADNLNFADLKDFMLSNNGETVSLQSRQGVKLFFNISSRSVTDDKLLYYTPFTERGTVKITNYRNTQTPSLNGVALKFLAEGETCRSACISTDGARIAWGGDYNLYLTDGAGQFIRKIALPEAAFEVNIAGKGKVVAAALGDGTIRWYSVQTGNELLAFYSSTDTRRWVLFSPKGYYDASPGAEGFLGWHVNKGPDTAPAFYPASRFKEIYYRPDIINAIAENWDEEGAVELANSRMGKTEQSITKEQLPPTVVINDPYTDTTFSGDQVLLTYTVQSPPDAPASDPEIRINSRPLGPSGSRGIKILSNKRVTVPVNVSRENCTISITVRNEYGVSPEAKVFLRYDSLAAGKEKNKKKPVLYLVAIGISDYNKPDYKLAYAADDAKDFAAAFMKQKGIMYQDVIDTVLLNKDATAKRISQAFDWVEKVTTKDDVAIIFFAGHGFNSNHNVFFMGPAEADYQDLRNTCIKFTDLTEVARHIPGKVIVFIDACHSGNVTGNQVILSDNKGAVNELGSSENGVVVFTSSVGREASWESPEWKHGAFTKALLEGIGDGEGASTVDKGKISIKSLDSYVSTRVKDLTKGAQKPTSIVPPDTPDFIIAISN